MEDLAKKRTRQARWARKKRAAETAQERETRLALRRQKRGLTPRNAARSQADYNREYYVRNREKLLERNRTWKAENPDRVRELRTQHEAVRRARKRTTQVDNDPRITALYEIAAWLRSQGDDVHVDHIRPLARGGTHTYENLQILTAQENMRKGAR